MPRVDGKVIFVTGAGRGQGRAHAVRLAQEGADIICCDILEDIATNRYPLSRRSDLDDTVRLIESYGRRVVARQGDVRDPAAMKAIVNEGVAELGRLDGVVANAGICPLAEPDPQAFFDVVTVNFNGMVHALDAALPHIVDFGSIAAIASVAALLQRTTDTSGPAGIGYALSKRLVASMVNDLALVLAPRMIRVNAVHPTNCNTDMLNSDIMYQAFRPDLQNPTREDALEAFPTMNAMSNPYVEPEDIANMVLFLMSDESRYVSGMQMRVDAGSIVRHRPQQPTF